MAEPILDASRVVTGIGQGVTAGVPEHVRRSENLQNDLDQNPIGIAALITAH
jgi:hypothetical protein